VKYTLGVDGGGSKTEIIIADLDGNRVSRVVSGASNYKSVGEEKAIDNLNKGIFGAIGKLNNTGDVYFVSSCFGFAGNDAGEDSKVYEKIVFNNKLNGYLNPEKTFILNDTRIGIEAGSDSKNKIIIIAGTGSNCFGINEDGREARASGWDYILSDEGSGYGVGLESLRAVMRAYDGRGRSTLLTGAILEELNLDKIPDLTGWAYSGPFSKNKISRLSKMVCETAGMGDKVSMDILREAAVEAAISVITVAKKLGLEKKSFDLVLVGGLFKCEKYFKNFLINKLKKKFPKINFMPLVAGPVEGAIKIAVEKMRTL